MKLKSKYLLAYMDMAKRFAETSEANRLKVCAMLIKNGSILSIGINGTPSGFYTNNCENDDGNTAWYVRHAEQACLDRMLHTNETTNNCIMLVTHQPCKICSLRIKDAGIKQVYYRYDYRCNQGVEYLLDNGVMVQKL